MKFLIWFIAILAHSLLVTILEQNGIILGGLPIFFFFFLTFSVAAAFSAKWDWRKFKRKAKKAGKTPVKYALSYYDSSIINMCYTYYADREELKRQLKQCVITNSITKRDSNVLKLLFRDRNSLIEFGLISDY